MQRSNLLLWLICCVGLVLTEDQTRLENAVGPDVVESVVTLIHDSCILPIDHLFLRRVALVETNDGRNFSTNTDGGIWGINQANFEKIQSDSNLTKYFPAIANQFGIQWANVQLHDLGKPLYSGIAAALLLTQNSVRKLISHSIQDQSAWYQKVFHPDDNSTAFHFSRLLQTSRNTCTNSFLDLAFLVESSTHVSLADFNLTKQFVSDVINTLNISSNAVRVAFITFSTGFKAHFNFSSYSDNVAVEAAIKAVAKTEGQTDTQAALEFAANKLFSDAGGSRSNAAKVVVLLLSGRSSHPTEAVLRAQELRDKGVDIFGIGIVGHVNPSELEQLSSRPSCTYYWQADKFQNLSEITNELQRLVCNVPKTLVPGDYSFPGDHKLTFRINVNGSTIITINSSTGQVELFGSFLSSFPNAAFNELAFIVDSEVTTVYVKSELRPLFLTAISQRNSSQTYSITVQPPNQLSLLGTKALCTESGIVIDCTFVDILMDSFNVTHLPVDFPNPCVGKPFQYLPHPLIHQLFVFCDNRGNAHIMSCPSNTSFCENPARCSLLECSPTYKASTGSDTSSYPTNVSTLTTSIVMPTNLTGVKTSTQPTATPVMQNLSLIYHPYPNDSTKYIQCQNPVIKTCGPGKIWNPQNFSCFP